MRVLCPFFLTLFIFFSCSSVITEPPLDELSQAVLLDFSVINETLNPVTVSIRHKYVWNYYIGKIENIFIAYSDWSTEYLNSGESKPVGVEKTKFYNGSAYQEMEGFILVDRALGLISSYRFISSFELQIETADDTLFIPGHILTGDETDENDLCRLMINIGSLGEISCRLITYKQDLFLYDWADDCLIVPAQLTIKYDGTVSFEHETIGTGE